MRQSKQDKQIDAVIAATYSRVCSGITINMLDIPKVFNVGREAILNGANRETLGQIMRDYVETIRC